MFGNGANEESNPKWTNKNWLKSRFHFSFAEYSGKPNFGCLRVMNDDLVQPNRGFGMHPHRDMEIVTYIVEGALTHEDSTGNVERLGRGSVQFMSAGSGIRHSERNENKDGVCRFIQMWITPRKLGLKPVYGGYSGKDDDRKNKWGHLVSDNNSKEKTPVKIEQDCNLLVSELEAGKSITFPLAADRQGYFLCLEGDVTVSGTNGEQRLDRHDAAEIKGKNDLTVKAGSKGAHVLLVEMQKK